MIRLTNAMTGLEGLPVALNPTHIVSVYKVFEHETRIGTTNNPEDFIVKESFDEVLRAVAEHRQGEK